MGALRPLASPRRTTDLDRLRLNGQARSAGDDSGGRPAVRHDAAAFAGTLEPTLVEVLNDPIVLSIMKRDGVPLDALQRLLHRIGRCLA